MSRFLLTSRLLYRRGFVVGALLAIGLVARLAMVLRPMEQLSRTGLVDDAFYYFQVARHIVAGEGVTFDGVNQTNGFHPLWMAMVVGGFGLGAPFEPATIIRALLLSVALLDVVTAWLIYRLLRGWTDDVAVSTLATTLYLFAPRVVVQAANGMGTSLSAFIMAVLTAWFAYLIAGPSREPRSVWKSSIVFGALAGFALLARTDNVFFVGMILLAWLTHARWRNRYQFRDLVTAGGAYAVACLLVVLPWTVWSFFRFGTVMQVSGEAPAQLNLSEAQSIHGLSNVLARQLPVFRTAIGDMFATIGIPSGGIRGPVFWVGLILLIWATLKRRTPDATRTNADGQSRIREIFRWFVVPSAVSIVAFCAAHSLLRGLWRFYYPLTYGPIVAILLGLFLAAVRSVVNPSKQLRLAEIAAVAWIALLLVVSPILSTRKRSVGVAAGQQAMMDGGLWLRAHTPDDVVVGSFNAGLVSYYADRRVVNLDGVINNAAYHATVEGRLADYICSQRISYIADFPFSLDNLDDPRRGRALPVETVYDNPIAVRRRRPGEFCSDCELSFRIVRVPPTSCAGVPTTARSND